MKKALFFLAFMGLFSLGTFAQPPDPGGGSGRVPITESIILLISGAIGLGIKTFKKNNKN